MLWAPVVQLVRPAFAIGTEVRVAYREINGKWAFRIIMFSMRLSGGGGGGGGGGEEEYFIALAAY